MDERTLQQYDSAELQRQYEYDTRSSPRCLGTHALGRFFRGLQHPKANLGYENLMDRQSQFAIDYKIERGQPVTDEALARDQALESLALRQLELRAYDGDDQELRSHVALTTVEFIANQSKRNDTMTQRALQIGDSVMSAVAIMAPIHGSECTDMLGGDIGVHTCQKGDDCPRCQLRTMVVAPAYHFNDPGYRQNGQVITRESADLQLKAAIAAGLIRPDDSRSIVQKLHEQPAA